MSETPTRRLPKPVRREQLLDTALAIVREQGTNALTLGYVAERAGVSKPIAYEHFKTRSGLLIAMYKLIDDRQIASLQQSFENAPRRLPEVARLIGESYVGCYADAGLEWHAIAAALKGDEKMEAVHQELIDNYANVCRDALAPYTALPKSELRLCTVGIIGAADAISREMVRGGTDPTSAASAIATLIVHWLSPPA